MEKIVALTTNEIYSLMTCLSHEMNGQYSTADEARRYRALYEKLESIQEQPEQPKFNCCRIHGCNCETTIETQEGSGVDYSWDYERGGAVEPIYSEYSEDPWFEM